MDPAMPRPTAKMTTQSWSSASEGLSVSCATGPTGVLLCQISGYGPEAAGMAESTDQLTGTSSALTWSYSCTGRTQEPLRPPTAMNSPSAPSVTPGKVPVSGHAWLACGPCHQPPGPAQLCCTGADVIPTIPAALPPGRMSGDWPPDVAGQVLTSGRLMCTSWTAPRLITPPK